jgi:hypothetical protein
MNRRGFLKLLGAAIAAPFVVKVKPKIESVSTNEVISYTTQGYSNDAAGVRAKWHLDEIEHFDSIWIQPFGPGTEIFPITIPNCPIEFKWVNNGHDTSNNFDDWIDPEGDAFERDILTDSDDEDEDEDEDEL